MEKDTMKRFIQEHKDAFDSDAPKDGLWANISSQLDEETGTHKTHVIYKYWLSVAAVVIVLLSSALMYLWYQQNNNDNNLARNSSPVVDSTLVELQDAEMFYASEIEQRKQELFTLAANMPEVKQDVQVEFAQLDSVYKQLKIELKNNVANESVIAAMIQNYRIRLEILENMLYYITKGKNEPIKEKSYEL